MRHSILFCVALALAVACDSAHVADGRHNAGPLTEAERSDARGVPAYADVVARIDGAEDRAYAGSAVLQVSTGSFEGTLLVLTTVAMGPTQGLTGHIRIPDDLAQTLATSGWDFTLSADRLGPEDGIVGDELNGSLQSISFRADPDGLFAAHATVDDSGMIRTVDIVGRLTGGCSNVDAEGGVYIVSDLASVPECQAVLGSL